LLHLLHQLATASSHLRRCTGSVRSLRRISERQEHSPYPNVTLPSRKSAMFVPWSPSV
jgi:hypothetical protein